MRIAMIGHKRVPSRDGGIEIVVEELATRMAAEGHEVVLYNRRGPGSPHSPKTWKGIVMRDIPTLNIKGSDAILYSIFAALAALFGRYDVVHFHAEGPSGMAWLTRLFRIPTVVTIHGLDWQRGKWGSLASWYIKNSEKSAARWADEMIVLSENMGEYFQQTYGRETQFIRNGIAVGSRPEPQEIRKLGLCGGDYVLFLARLVPEKGIHYLLEAFRGLDTELKLVIAGDLKNTEYVRQIQEMAAKDPRVILPGFVQGRLLEELYSHCRLYVLPSDVEGMPLSLLEALSFGAPCLVSDIPESQVAPETFLTTFRHGEPVDLRRKMERLLVLAPSKEVQAAQIAWMRDNYSWNAVVEQTLALYRKAAAKKKGEKHANA